MCGVCGIVTFDGRPIAWEHIESMTRALAHRGPDDEQFYFSKSPDEAVRAALGFRRLSIIDVAEGRQPMRFGSKVIVFNGEIYNFRELRSELESRGRKFATHSDTEVLLQLVDQYGERGLEKLNGMFAFAVWDEERRELFAARDRLGIKPLYYAWNGRTFVFASEIGALYRSGEIAFAWDPAGVSDFFSFRFVPAPFTVLRGVRKIRPGHFVRVRDGRLAESRYWALSPQQPLTGAPALEQLDALLNEAVRLQLVSDVPLGAFLSGGVDSSLIAALMKRHAGGPVKTFSIGFEPGTGVDESRFAREVARHLGTEHHELQLTEKDLSVGGDVFSRMNEPVGDPTVLPTAILSKFARESVKVALTGEGGDELFAGYNRYKPVVLADWAQSVPSGLRPVASAAFRRTGRGRLFRAIPDLTPDNWFTLNRDFREDAIASVLADGALTLSSHLLSDEVEKDSPLPDPLNRILDLERRTALVDRLLMKVDMASMGASLEARPPYLDHRVVEFAMSLPASEKIRRFKGKFILRQAAEKYLPHSIAWRRKHGFIVPIVRWLGGRSPERWEALLSDSKVRAAGLFDARAVQERKEKIYNEGDDESVALLWPVLVLTSWASHLKSETL